jgi:hypothetical protein
LTDEQWEAELIDMKLKHWGILPYLNTKVYG